MSMPSATSAGAATTSIAGRAVLAVVLMIGFYILALGIAFGLLWLVYADVVYAHRLHAKLALACAVGAGAILWSVMPRFDKFEAPGPLLSRREHPRLFTEIESIAKSTGQTMPSEVFLVPDINAWVAQRGGVMGFGSRRVMGLGLPLLRVLSRSQFRAVLAHEFGHFYGGDTKLGPWVYKTRGAIGRTLETLGDESWLQLPFRGYGKMFLRITHAVSRRQEFVADALAARAVGSKPLIDGLRVVHGVGPAFGAYWANECAPVLNAGFRPPLVDGFVQFVETDRIADAINKQLDEELQTAKADPYDTHPPLKERIAAVAHLPVGELSEDDTAAVYLLDNLPALENQMLVALAGADAAGKLQPIQWKEVGSRVYLPQWRKLVEANAAALNGLTSESLPACASDLAGFGKRFKTPSGEEVEEEHAGGLAVAVIGAALALITVNRGAVVDAEPGRNVSVTLGSASLEPFNVMSSLAEGKLTSEAWQQQCASLGLAGLNLGTALKA